ncbi:MAG: competence/damage-inducible protein A, partial [Deltaproteobacteria bacterium]|nr:competence/damage-inducible protein A [Deltaproteobacteria bacterium]
YYGAPLSDEQRCLAMVPEGTELVFGDPRWPVMRYRNLHILPGVPSLFRKCFDSIKEQFATSRRLVARVYVGCDETELAAALSTTVESHPALKFGSYPRWEETDYRVMLTVEGPDEASVAAGLATLCSALGDRVVRSEGPRAATADLS